MPRHQPTKCVICNSKLLKLIGRETFFNVLAEIMKIQLNAFERLCHRPPKFFMAGLIGGLTWLSFNHFATSSLLP